MTDNAKSYGEAGTYPDPDGNHQHQQSLDDESSTGQYRKYPPTLPGKQRAGVGRWLLAIVGGFLAGIAAVTALLFLGVDSVLGEDAAGIVGLVQIGTWVVVTGAIVRTSGYKPSVELSGESARAAAESSDWSRRRMAALSRSASTDVLWKLSKDQKSSVRMAVASNPSTPREILETIAENETEVGVADSARRALKQRQ